MALNRPDVVEPPLVGVRGWLAFFCVILMVLNPFMSVALWGQTQSKIDHLKTTAPDMAEMLSPVMAMGARLALLGAAFSFVAGMMLVKRAKGAVLVAKLFVTSLPFASLSQYLFISDGLPENLRDAMQSAITQEVIRSSVFCAIWLAYLCTSRRVRDTYRLAVPSPSGDWRPAEP